VTVGIYISRVDGKTLDAVYLRRWCDERKTAQALTGECHTNQGN